jgi:predicted PurR-regulated permease PerM
MVLGREVNYTKKIYALLVIVSLVALVYCASNVLFPLFLAFILAVLMRPVDSFLQRKWKFPKIVSVAITELLLLSLFALILYLVAGQLKEFFKELPETKERLMKVAHDIADWIYHKFGVSIMQQQTFLKENLMNGSSDSSGTFGSISNVFGYLALLPVYIFLFMFYRNLLLEFLMRMVNPRKSEKMQVIVNDIKFIVRKYIIGLLLEIVVVATLMFIGLSILGIKFALFLALLTALLNLIPYVGVLVANVLNCLIAFSFNPNPEQSILGVMAVTGLVQFIDNMILMPRIVGNNVRINALASILCVIVGGSLAGVAGMFLAIPITAIIKVILDSVPQWEAYGFLLGDEMPRRVYWTKKSDLKEESQQKENKRPPVR